MGERGQVGGRDERKDEGTVGGGHGGRHGGRGGGMIPHQGVDSLR